MNSKDIISQKLPHVYPRGDNNCYIDPIRDKLICVTPEETVRQKVISYLLKVMKIPKQMLDVEAALVDYEVKSPRRADILILNENEEPKYPVAVIECKAPDVAIDDKGVNQVWDYCRQLNAEYAVITNSYDFRFYHYDGESFEQMDELPGYEEMLEGEVYEYTPPEPFRRIPFGFMDEFVRKLDEYRWVIGSSSDYDIAWIGINLYECFMDTKHKMPVGKYKLFTLIEDYGVRNLTCGNSSGGKFNGNYRSLLIKYKGNVGFVSFSVFSYSTYAKPDEIKTALIIAIDDGTSSHDSLEYVLDKHIKIENYNTALFCHDGRITVGNIGPTKVKYLIAMVKRKYPDIIDEGGICLGKLKMDKLWRLDLKRVIDVMENMISYVLIRDDLRKKLKQQKAETVKNGD